MLLFGDISFYFLFFSGLLLLERAFGGFKGKDANGGMVLRAEAFQRYL